MSPPLTSRRSVVEALCGACVGLFAYAKRPRYPGFDGGVLQAYPWGNPETTPPEEYVTPYDDERIADVEPIREAVRDSPDPIELSRREFGEVSIALEELPAYDRTREVGTESPTRHTSPVIRYEGDLYFVSIGSFCEDRWWVGTRGNYHGDRSLCVVPDE